MINPTVARYHFTNEALHLFFVSDVASNGINIATIRFNLRFDSSEFGFVARSKDYSSAQTCELMCDASANTTSAACHDGDSFFEKIVAKN